MGCLPGLASLPDAFPPDSLVCFLNLPASRTFRPPRMYYNSSCSSTRAPAFMATSTPTDLILSTIFPHDAMRS